MILILSCKDDEADTPVLAKNYGEGMYIVTDMGFSFYNYFSFVSSDSLWHSIIIR